MIRWGVFCRPSCSSNAVTYRATPQELPTGRCALKSCTARRFCLRFCINVSSKAFCIRPAVTFSGTQMLARWAAPAQLRSIPRRVPSVCSPSPNVLSRCGNEKLAFAVYKSGCSSGCIRGCTTAACTSQCQERKPCGCCDLWPKEARRGRHILALQSNAVNQPQDGPRSRWRGSQGAFQPVPQSAFDNEPPLQIETGNSVASLRDMSRSPQALVKYLDNYIVGQTQAKRAVAVALRQRWRRRQVGNSCAPSHGGAPTNEMPHGNGNNVFSEWRLLLNFRGVGVLF